MAGESPGRSEQRKSSGETAGERDPRLAVFRERTPQASKPVAPEAKPDASGGSADGAPDEVSHGAADAESADTAGRDTQRVDQPTGIFRTRPRAAEGPAGEREAGAKDATEPAPDSGAASRSDSGAEAESGGVPESGTAPGADELPEPETESRSQDDDGPESGPAAAAAEGSGVSEGSGGSGVSEGSEGSEPGDSRLREAVAAWVATTDDPEAETGTGTDPEGTDGAGGRGPADAPSTPESRKRNAKSDADAGTDADADSGLNSRSASDSASASDSDSDSDSESAEGESSAATSAAIAAAAFSGARAARAVREADGGEQDRSSEVAGAKGTKNAGANPSGSSGSPADAQPSAAAAAGDPVPDDEDAAEAESAGPKAAGPKAAGPKAAAPEVVAPKSAEPKPAGAKPAGARSGTSGKASDEGDGGSDGKGIDQATAVFTTVRPSASEVDQPTAMLKLPPTDPQAPRAPKGGPSSKVARPESDTERTSTFVPLKPDGVRPPAPPRRPGATGTSGATGAQQGRPGAPLPQAGAGTGSAAGAQAAATGGIPEAERTKQQPLPPKPPLDLLAELTNKPAPPETPVRTTVRRFKIWTPLVLLLLVVFAAVQMFRPLPDPRVALTASPSYTFEGGSLKMPWPGEGQSAIEVEGVGSMGTEGAQQPKPIASMAKAMTAYVILKDHPIKGKENGPKITVDQPAEDDGKKGDESTAKIKKGQEFTQRQMLMMLMIPSGNNVARLLGRWDAGSEEKFLEKMNAAAKDLGMTNTKYTDSSGFDKGTVSTPVDQIKLGRAVMKNDVFREIVDMPEVEIPGLPGKIYNNNKILLSPGVNGIKTGSTTPAGGNLLFTASTIIDGKERRIIGAVMNQTTGAILNDKLDKAIFDSLKLIKKAQEVVTSAQVVKKGDVVGYVDDGLGGRTPVVATQDLKAVGWPGLKVDLAAGPAAGKTVPHTAKAGDVVGQVTVGTGPGQVQAPVALKSDLVEPGFGAKLQRLG
ncbi:D-alanyl-D-alanine carboxypeptidase [Streptomyces sp. NPDC058657]|uniref:D-alanyl-D-alanine carboxypeptidase family protein n=1 Tax=unclassified Streptomyces TaxID=2593676 RepID=UPI003665113E